MKRSLCHEDIIDSLPFRFFAVEIDDNTQYWISITKSEDDFLADIRKYSSQSKNLDKESILKFLPRFLDDEGYISVEHLVSERFQGHLLSTRAKIVPKD